MLTWRARLACTPCPKSSYHISRHKQGLYPRGEHDAQYGGILRPNLLRQCRFQKTAAAVTRSPLQWKPMAALSGRGALRFPRATQSMARRLPQRSSGQKARHRSCLLVKRPVTEEICWSAECSEDICNALNLLNCHCSRLPKPTFLGLPVTEVSVQILSHKRSLLRLPRRVICRNTSARGALSLIKFAAKLLPQAKC